MSKNPEISIIIPCKNEEDLISKCLDSVINFELPNKINTEILILDGMSDDNTKNIINEFQKKDSRVELIDNPGQFQSFALNIAIKIAKGDWILRLDAHSVYPKNYLKLCYETAIKTGADNVGGILISKRNGKSYQAGLVQALTTHKFGVGNSGFRTGDSGGEADSVPYGFYKKEVFSKIGLLDERLIRAQDYEFNRRLAKSGGLIYMSPSININYYNQKTLSKFLYKQIKLEAPYNAYMWYLAPYTLAYRHIITGFFSTGFIGGLLLSPLSFIIKNIFISVIILYFFLSLISSFQQALRYKNIFHIIFLPISFFLYHFLHGLGVLFGCLNIILGRSPVQKIKEPWKGYGKFRIDIDNLLEKNADK